MIFSDYSWKMHLYWLIKPAGHPIECTQICKDLVTNIWYQNGNIYNLTYNSVQPIIPLLLKKSSVSKVYDDEVRGNTYDDIFFYQ